MKRLPFYKFLTPSRLDVLQNCTMRITQAGALNDPFELRVALPNNILRHLKGVYLAEKAQKLTTADSFDEWLDTERGKLYQETWKDAVPSAEMETEATAEYVGNHVGFSLSEALDNVLMWAHYGDRHRGFVIEFDMAHPFFSDRTKFGLRKVHINTRRMESRMMEISYLVLLHRVISF